MVFDSSIQDPGMNNHNKLIQELMGLREDLRIEKKKNKELSRILHQMKSGLPSPCQFLVEHSNDIIWVFDLTEKVFTFCSGAV